MSWTTSAPVSSLASRQAHSTPSNPTSPLVTTHFNQSAPPVAQPPSTANSEPQHQTRSGPRPLTLVTSSAKGPFSAKPRTPIAPNKLAKLANALGVSTPVPLASQNPLYSLRSPASTSALSSAFGAPSPTPSQYFLHVIPPIHLPLGDGSDDEDDTYRTQHRRGTLVALHPTLQAQLLAIARHYALPSTGGMILYLITGVDGPGPRVTDDAWKMLWYRVVKSDRAAMGGLSVSNFPSRSGSPALISYPSPRSPYGSTGPGSVTGASAKSSQPDLRRPSTSTSPESSEVPSPTSASVELPVNIDPSAPLPVIAKVEFDIDRRKAPWYESWRQRRRRADSLTSNQSGRELKLPKRSRSANTVNDYKLEFRRKFVLEGRSSPDNTGEFLLESPQSGYAPLADDEGKSAEGSEMDASLSNGKDPLAGVFPSDERTWAGFKEERLDAAESDSRVGLGLLPAAEIQEGKVGLGGKLVNGEQSPIIDSDISDGDDVEDVVAIWKAKHQQAQDPSPLLQASPTGAADKSLPPTPSSVNVGLPFPGKSLSGGNSKHIPPPLNLSGLPSPRVVVAPPSAPPSATAQSYLPYLDSANSGKQKDVSQHADIKGDPNKIAILVNGPSSAEIDKAFFPDDESDNEGMRTRPGSLVGAEEFRSRALDELEKKIDELSPRNWSPEESEQFHGGGFAALQAKALGEGKENDNGVNPPSTPSDAPLMSASTDSAPFGLEDKILSKNEESTATLSSAALVNRSGSQGSVRSSTLHASTTEAEQEGDQDVMVPPSSPMFPLSPDPFGRRPMYDGDEEPSSPTRQSRPSMSSIGSPTSQESSGARRTPPLPGQQRKMSSRFSQDSLTEEETAAKGLHRERSNSIISVKGIRSLWRKSGANASGTPGGSAKQQPPLSPVPPSPGVNGTFGTVPPPLPSGGFMSFGTGGYLSSGGNGKKNASAPGNNTAASNSASTHRKSDSGLDPFHFDQESRYPVRRSPSPSFAQYTQDMVPPPIPSTPGVSNTGFNIPPIPSTPVPTTPTVPAPKTKGILKGWGRSSKRGSGSGIPPLPSEIPPPSPALPAHVAGSIGSTTGTTISVSVPNKEKKKRPSVLDFAKDGATPKGAKYPSPPNSGVPPSQTSPITSPALTDTRKSVDTLATGGTRLSDFEMVSPPQPQVQPQAPAPKRPNRI